MQLYSIPLTHCKQVHQSLETSLKNLRTSYVDSLVLHSPMRSLADTMEVWTAFEELVDQEKVRQLGISNCYNLDMLRSLYNTASVKPSVVQNRFYGEVSYCSDIRDFCREKNIAFQSFWTLSGNPAILSSPTFRKISASHDITPEQLMFLYLIHHGVTPLSGTTSVQHMKEDLAVLEMAPLSADEALAITQLLT